MLNYCGIDNNIDSTGIGWIAFWFVWFQIWISVYVILQYVIFEYSFDQELKVEIMTVSVVFLYFD